MIGQAIYAAGATIDMACMDHPSEKIGWPQVLSSNKARKESLLEGGIYVNG